MKYFVLGAFSSAFFLYGIALIYGATGSTNLVDIADFLATTRRSTDSRPRCWPASRCCSSGFGFKVAAVPFHFWTPDVYQGAPSPSVAYMASGVKVAGFAGLLRVFVRRLRHLPASTGSRSSSPSPSLTLVVGSVLAIVQTDVKRMLAYSSINHAGLHPRGGAGRERAGRRRPRSSTWPPTRSWSPAASASSRSISRKGDIGNDLDDYRGLSRDRAGPRPHVHAVPAGPGRRAVHLRLLRQVLRDRRRGRRGVHRVGDHRHAHGRDRGVPLPADHRLDVHVGGGGRRAPHRSACPSPPVWPWPPVRRSPWASGCSPASLSGPAEDATPALVLEPVEVPSVDTTAPSPSP